LKILVDASADVNVKNVAGYAPLHVALMGAENTCSELDNDYSLNLPFDPVCFRILLEHGADVGVKDDHGQNLLHIAVAQVPVHKTKL
jgi:ankyrin repeat protein